MILAFRKTRTRSNAELIPEEEEVVNKYKYNSDSNSKTVYKTG